MLIKDLFLSSANRYHQKIKYILFGVANVVISWIVYFIALHFIIRKKNFDFFGMLTISPHVFSLFMSFISAFILGFLFNYFFVFKAIKNGNVIFVVLKYFMGNIGSLIINYILLKFLVEGLHFYPTPSQVLSTCLITVYSFLVQKYYTFKTA